MGGGGGSSAMNYLDPLHVLHEKQNDSRGALPASTVARQKAERANAARLSGLAPDAQAAVRSNLIRAGYLSKSQGLLEARPGTATTVTRYGG